MFSSQSTYLTASQRHGTVVSHWREGLPKGRVNIKWKLLGFYCNSIRRCCLSLKRSLKQRELSGSEWRWILGTPVKPVSMAISCMLVSHKWRNRQRPTSAHHVPGSAIGICMFDQHSHDRATCLALVVLIGREFAELATGPDPITPSEK